MSGQGYGGAPVATEEAPGGLGAMIAGILGLVVFPLIPSIIAIVMGGSAKKQARAQPGRYKEDFATIGIVTGWIGVVLTPFGILIAVVLVSASP